MDKDGNSEVQSGYGSAFFFGFTEADMIEAEEVTKIPFAEEVADTWEKTHLKSPGRRKEYGAGLIEPGEDTLELNYLPGSPTDLKFAEAHRTGKALRYESFIPAVNGKWWRISGFLIVTSRGRNVPINDRMTQTINVRFTGVAGEAGADAQRKIAAPAGA